MLLLNHLLKLFEQLVRVFAQNVLAAKVVFEHVEMVLVLCEADKLQVFFLAQLDEHPANVGLGSCENGTLSVQFFGTLPHRAGSNRVDISLRDILELNAVIE